MLDPPGAGVTSTLSCLVGSGDWGPLQEQSALLTAEPSLQPSGSKESAAVGTSGLRAGWCQGQQSYWAEHAGKQFRQGLSKMAQGLDNRPRQVSRERPGGERR